MVDWYSVTRVLMHGSMTLRPWEIQRLTETEICLALDSDLETPRGPEGIRSQTDEELMAWAEWRRSLSLRDELDLARRE